MEHKEQMVCCKDVIVFKDNLHSLDYAVFEGDRFAIANGRNHAYLVTNDPVAAEKHHFSQRFNAFFRYCFEDHKKYPIQRYIGRILCAYNECKFEVLAYDCSQRKCLLTPRSDDAAAVMGKKVHFYDEWIEVWVDEDAIPEIYYECEYGSVEERTDIKHDGKKLCEYDQFLLPDELQPRLQNGTSPFVDSEDKHSVLRREEYEVFHWNGNSYVTILDPFDQTCCKHYDLRFSTSKDEDFLAYVDKFVKDIIGQGVYSTFVPFKALSETLMADSEFEVFRNEGYVFLLVKATKAIYFLNGEEITYSKEQMKLLVKDMGEHADGYEYRRINRPRNREIHYDINADHGRCLQDESGVLTRPETCSDGTIVVRSAYHEYIVVDKNDGTYMEIYCEPYPIVHLLTQKQRCMSLHYLDCLYEKFEYSSLDEPMASRISPELKDAVTRDYKPFNGRVINPEDPYSVLFDMGNYHSGPAAKASEPALGDSWVTWANSEVIESKDQHEVLLIDKMMIFKEQGHVFYKCYDITKRLPLTEGGTSVLHVKIDIVGEYEINDKEIKLHNLRFVHEFSLAPQWDGIGDYYITYENCSLERIQELERLMKEEKVERNLNARLNNLYGLAISKIARFCMIANDDGWEGTWKFQHTGRQLLITRAGGKLEKWHHRPCPLPEFKVNGKTEDLRKYLVAPGSYFYDSTGESSWHRENLDAIYLSVAKLIITLWKGKPLLCFVNGQKLPIVFTDESSKDSYFCHDRERYNKCQTIELKQYFYGCRLSNVLRGGFVVNPGSETKCILDYSLLSDALYDAASDNVRVDRNSLYYDKSVEPAVEEKISEVAPLKPKASAWKTIRIFLIFLFALYVLKTLLMLVLGVILNQ